MTACRRCAQDRKFVKAHAIPEAFFRVLRAGVETPLLVSGEPGLFRKRAPIGVYDEEMLCEAGEPLFGTIDAYGIEVLLNKFDEYFHPVPQRVALESDQGGVLAIAAAGRMAIGATRGERRTRHLTTPLLGAFDPR